MPKNDATFNTRFDKNRELRHGVYRTSKHRLSSISFANPCLLKKIYTIYLFSCFYITQLHWLQLLSIKCIIGDKSRKKSCEKLCEVSLKRLAKSVKINVFIASLSMVVKKSRLMETWTSLMLQKCKTETWFIWWKIFQQFWRTNWSAKNQLIDL